MSKKENELLLQAEKEEIIKFKEDINNLFKTSYVHGYLKAMENEKHLSGKNIYARCSPDTILKMFKKVDGDWCINYSIIDDEDDFKNSILNSILRAIHDYQEMKEVN